GLQAPRGQRQQRPQVVRGAGSGFVIDKSGFILTSHHVIEGATRIEVFLSDMPDARNGGRGLPARIVGSDVLSDTALLQVTELPDPPLGVFKVWGYAQLA